MKKINFIRANKTGGGAENYLSRLMKVLNEKNIDFEVTYSNVPKFVPSWLKAILFNYKVCNNRKDEIYFSLDRIVCPDIYRAGDGVHKVYLKEKGFSFNPLHIVYLYLEKRCFKNAKKIISNSKMIKNEIMETYKIEDSKIEVIYNGIPLKDKVDFSDLIKEFNIKNEKIILFVGSGFERKGVKEFLDIISKIKSEFKAFVVGKDKKIDWYKNYAKNLGLEKKVIFTGLREDVDKFYSMSDIFLFPTKYEPFSNVVLEAMNFEMIVFTTKKNGASEVLPEEWLIDSEIKEKIENLLTNENFLKKEKQKAKDISKNFSIEKNVKETLKVINEIID